MDSSVDLSNKEYEDALIFNSMLSDSSKNDDMKKTDFILKEENNWAEVQNKKLKRLDNRMRKLIKMGKGRALQSGVRMLCDILETRDVDRIYMRPYYPNAARLNFEDEKQRRIHAKEETIKDINNKINKIRESLFVDDNLVDVTQVEAETDLEDVEILLQPKNLDFNDVIKEAKLANQRLQKKRDELDYIMSEIPLVVRKEFDKQLSNEVERVVEPMRKALKRYEEKEFKVTNIDYKELYIEEIIIGNIMRVELGEPTKAPITIGGGILKETGVDYFKRDDDEVAKQNSRYMDEDSEYGDDDDEDSVGDDD